jgi:argininosuccinate lyase
MITEALDPVSSINRRKIAGGPAPEEVLRYLAKRQTDLELDKQEIANLKNIINSAFENLLAIVNEYGKA